MNSPPLQYIGLFIYGSAWHRLRCVVSVIFAAMFSLLTTSQIFTSASEKSDYHSNTHTQSLSLAARGATSSPLASYLSWPATFLTHSNRDFFFYLYQRFVDWLFLNAVWWYRPTSRTSWLPPEWHESFYLFYLVPFSLLMDIGWLLWSPQIQILWLVIKHQTLQAQIKSFRAHFTSCVFFIS